MVLKEQGKLDLDRPINEYLGEAKLRARVPPGCGEAAQRLLRVRWVQMSDQAGTLTGWACRGRGGATSLSPDAVLIVDGVRSAAATAASEGQQSETDRR
jgi:hypothetical protein